MNTRVLAVIILGAGLAVIAALGNAVFNEDATTSAKIPGDARPADVTSGGAASVVLGPNDRPISLLTVSGVGQFIAQCRPVGSMTVQFVAARKGATVHATVMRSGSPALSRFVNPGKRLRIVSRLPAQGIQQWQLAQVAAAGARVVVVDIAGGSASSIGNPGCHISGYATSVRQAT